MKYFTKGILGLTKASEEEVKEATQIADLFDEEYKEALYTQVDAFCLDKSNLLGAIFAKPTDMLMGVSQIEDEGKTLTIMLVDYNLVTQVAERAVSKGKEQEFCHAMTSTLAHELVHVRQFKEGRLALRAIGSDQFIWDGELWTPERCQEVGYINLPWEQDAMAIQMAYLQAKGLIPSAEQAIADLKRDARLGGRVH